MPTPKTWATNDKITATLWNQETRDNINAVQGKPRALIYKTIVSEFSTMSTSFGDPAPRTLVNVQFDKVAYDYAYDGSKMAYGSKLMFSAPGWYRINAAHFWDTGNTFATATPLVGTRNLAFKTNSSGRFYCDRVMTAGIVDATRWAWTQDPALSPAGTTALVQPVVLTDVIFANKGDYVEAFAGQDSGNPLRDYVINADSTAAGQSAAAFTSFLSATLVRFA
ncbi:MAG: hypothetical protein ACRDU4_00750 [Mycobacterium sp.]